MSSRSALSAPTVRAAAGSLLAGSLLAGSLLGAPAAAAAPGGTTTVTTRAGVTLSATPVRGLPSPATITVRGKGFRQTVGIYVALCVTPAAGTQPTTCGGGVNTTGRNPASAWISSNPPPYGAMLARPFGRGGTFTVRLTVSPILADGIDCRTTSCAIVTRADHTRPGDRRSDAVIPVRFTR